MVLFADRTLERLDRVHGIVTAIQAYVKRLFIEVQLQNDAVYLGEVISAKVSWIAV
jgi:hypothetical protein